VRSRTPLPLSDRAAGEGIAVDADGNVYAVEGPNSMTQAGGAFTKYSGTESGFASALESVKILI